VIFKTGGGDETNITYNREVLKYDTSVSFCNDMKNERVELWPCPSGNINP